MLFKLRKEVGCRNFCMDSDWLFGLAITFTAQENRSLCKCQLGLQHFYFFSVIQDK